MTKPVTKSNTDGAAPAATLRKAHRLHHRRKLEWLFQHGRSISQHPMRLLYCPQPTDWPHPQPEWAEAAFSVPKRQHRRAHQRNHIRRRIKEAYRLHKHVLVAALAARQQYLWLCWLYAHKQPLPYASIAAAVQSLLAKLITQLPPKP